MVKLQNKMDWTPGAFCFSKTVGPSETVPDDTLTIKQILAKHVRGMQIEADAMRTPIYNDGDYDSPDLEAVSRMDLSERHEFLTHLRSDVERRRAEIKALEEKLKAKNETAVSKSDSSLPSEKGKSEGDARLGENPPDDLPRRPKHAGRRSERSGGTEPDTQGVTAGE